MMSSNPELEAQIDQWRGYVQRRRAIGCRLDDDDTEAFRRTADPMGDLTAVCDE